MSDAGVDTGADLDVGADREVVTTARLETFSDGIFAIAATLLVLDLHVPLGVRNGRLLHELFTGHQLAEYAAYAVSFLIIGITWLNHHSVFRQVERVDRTVTLLNLLLLATIAILPFPTQVLAEYLNTGGSNAHAAAFFYSLVMAVMSLLWASLWWYVTSNGCALLNNKMDDVAVRKSRLQFSGGVLLYVPLLGLSFVSAGLTLGLQAALAAYYALDPLRR
jgi:uncharacterized membrane protein